MKTIVIFLSVIVGVAWGGVGVLTPEIEAEAYRLWNAFCDGGSDGGNGAGISVYCKRARGVVRQTLEHRAELPQKDESGNQVVFVQPPSYHYKHDVVVTGGGVAARKTVIYVKPAKNTHEVNVQDQTQPNAAPQKPQLFFLTGNHGSVTSTESSAEPATTPPPTYLPPTTTAGYNYRVPKVPFN